MRASAVALASVLLGAALAVPSQAADPLLLGNVGTYSGVAANPTYQQGLQAWADETNARGGIAGRQVKLLTRDDQGDPATHRSEVQRLLKAGVVALVGAAGVEGEDAQLLRGTAVPVLGATSAAQEMIGSSPVLTPSGTAPQALTFGYLRQGRLAGGRNLYVVRCVEVCSGAEYERITSGGYARAAGLTVVGEQGVSLVAPSYQAQCSQLQRSGADTAAVLLDAGSSQRFINDCTKLGVRVRYLLAPNSLRDDRQLTPTEGTVAVSPIAPWFVYNTNATRARNNSLSNRGVPRTTASTQAYTAGELVRTLAVRVAKTGAITGPRLRGAAGQLRQETLAGLTAPLTGRGAQAAEPSRCWFALAWRQGRWTAPDALRPTCGSKP